MKRPFTSSRLALLGLAVATVVAAMLARAVLTAQSPASDADSHFTLASEYEKLSRFADALAQYELALDGYRGANRGADEARTLLMIAQVHKNTGQYARGTVVVNEAIGRYAAIGDKKGAARAWVTLGAIQDSTGAHREALESFTRALPLLESEKNHELLNLLNEIGITEKNLGRYADARRHYARGLELAREIDDQNMNGFFLLNLGVLDGVLGEMEQAVETGRQALAVFRKIGHRRGEAIVLQNLSAAYWALGNHPRALETMQGVLEAARAMGLRTVEGEVLKDLGDMYAAAGDATAAQERYDQALRLQREIGDRKAAASTLIAIANSRAGLGRSDEALPLAEDGLRLALETARPELEWSARQSIALAAAAAGDRARAIAELQRSARIVNDLRANVLEDMSKVAFVDNRQAVFQELADFLLADGRVEQALEAAEAGRARAFADLLRQRLVVGKPADRDALAAIRVAEDAYVKDGATAPTGLRGGGELLTRVAALDGSHRELASLLTAKSPTIDEIRQTAKSTHATLVEYLVTDQRLLAWVVGPDGSLHSTAVDVPRARLESLVRSVRDEMDASVAKPGSLPTAALARSLRESGRLLIDPIEPWLPASAREPVILIPQGALALLPFAAVQDGAGRPLIARHVLAFAPAASVFAYTAAKQSTTSSRGRVLVIADPTPPPDSALAHLPWAREEGRRVADQMRTRGVHVLMGDDATEAAVKREAGRYSILHFATHGLVVPERPLASSLTLRDGDGEDGYLRTDEIFNLDLSAELVVLSGCSTGLGKLTGDGIVGLTRAFLYAGTPTIVVSQWNVSDRATSRLMDRFYAAMRAGSSKAQALRDAALALRQQMPNPAFWAPFEVVGQP